MSAISQYKKDFFDDCCIELGVELSTHVDISSNMIIHVPQAFESDFHQFWLLMLDSKDDWLENAFKAAGIQVEKTLCTVPDDVLNELKEAFSEFRELNEVIHDHL